MWELSKRKEELGKEKTTAVNYIVNIYLVNIF